MIWLNGIKIGEGDDSKRVYSFNVREHLRRGENVIAVEARNIDGPAGLLARLGYVPNGQSRLAIVSNGSWKSASSSGESWRNVAFDDRAWRPVKVLGTPGRAGPWSKLTWDSTIGDRFSVPTGFTVETVISARDAKSLAANVPFSLINMCFDAKGRMLVAQERGPILLCSLSADSGNRVRPYCDLVRNCQGMCWVRGTSDKGDSAVSAGALLLVGDGPQGVGLYRVQDRDGDDLCEQITLLHRFVGEMGEHGPHAVLHGPDGWLYVVVGNGAWAKPHRLAANSPLTRWPDGQMGPD